MTDTAGSESVHEFYCEICNEEGRHAEANGFCSDCKDYLCTRCVTDHKRNRVTRFHDVLDKDGMPQDAPPPTDRVRKDITTVCKLHKGELVRFYCTHHATLVCAICVVENHDECKEKENIAKKAEGIFDDNEYKDLIQNLNSLKIKVAEVSNEARNKFKEVDEQFSNDMDAIREFRDEINSLLDELERDMKEKVEMKRSEVSKMINFESSTYEKLQKDLDELISEFNSLQSDNRICQTYISIKRAIPEVKSIGKRLGETKERSSIKTYIFQSNRALSDLLKSSNAFGKLVLSACVHEKASLINERSATVIDSIQDIFAEENLSIESELIIPAMIEEDQPLKLSKRQKRNMRRKNDKLFF